MNRVISALLLFPLVVVLLIFGNVYVVDIVFSAVALLAMSEYFNAFKEKANPVKWLGYIGCILIAFIHIIPVDKVVTILGIGIPAVFLVLFLQVIITNMKTTFNDIAITFFGICYIVGFIMFLPLLLGKENGKILIWYIVFCAWGTDIFAYIFGKLMGKHKFSKVSPNKSIEGCIGGALGAIIIALIYTFAVNTCFNIGHDISYISVAIVAAVLSIVGQIGDFAASSIKRYTGIKDYSNLIPGHGGMLDRIDSVIFIAPFAYYLLMII